MEWLLGKVTPSGVTGFNTGIITVLSGTTLIFQTGNFSAIAGDFIMIFGECLMAKGATTGNTTIHIQAVGVSGDFDGPLSSNFFRSHPASTTERFQMFQIQRCMTTGSINFRLQMTSAGSNGTVQPEAGVITVLTFNQN